MVELMTIPTISTAHLTEEVAERLSAEGDKNPWCPCACWEYGFFLYLEHPEGEENGSVPRCLLDIRDWINKQAEAGAIQKGWVRLDADADSAEGLPTYDW